MPPPRRVLIISSHPRFHGIPSCAIPFLSIGALAHNALLAIEASRLSLILGSKKLYLASDRRRSQILRLRLAWLYNTVWKNWRACVGRRWIWNWTQRVILASWYVPITSLLNSKLILSQKSAFSWTTTSTSRYIDVAEALLEDSGSDMSSYESISPPSPNGSPNKRYLPPLRIHTDSDNASEWFSVQPGDSALEYYFRPTPPRKLHKKPSRTMTPSPCGSEPPISYAYPNEVLDSSQCAICSRCRQQIRDCITNPMHDSSHAGPRSAGHAHRHQTSPLSQPRKPLKPVRSMSQPEVSRPARPEDVLSRSFYNHERGHPDQPLPYVPDYRPSLAHFRSHSDSAPVRRAAPANLSHSRSRSHDTPTRSFNLALPHPSLPPAPNYKLRAKSKSVAPPTSYRPIPVSDRGTPEPRCPTPVQRPSSAGAIRSSTAAISIPRSHSHSALPDRARLGRIRTNSLSSLSSVASVARGALAAVTATPLRNILHPHPTPVVPMSSPPEPDDDVWVRVDVKSKDSSAMDV